MDKRNVLSFSEALAESDKKCRSLFLGNGFSKSISTRFGYEDLLELANTNEKLEKHQLPDELMNIFTDLETVDFEKVIAHLEVAEIVIRSYSKSGCTNIVCNQLAQKIKDDKDSAKKSFVHAINYTHQGLAQNIKDDTYSKAGDLLFNFDYIFTINYDLLLYWLLMRKRERVGASNFKFDDGFTSWGWGINEQCLNSQNIFYLHGALHFFSLTNLFKIRAEEYDNITNKITKHILNGKYPLTIMEGKHESKKKKILENSYLSHCYKKMKNTNGSLFILGTSLNIHADAHIYHRIKQSSFDSIYFGIYDNDDKDLIEWISSLGWNNGKKIAFFDPGSAIDWKQVEDNDDDF
ncbi:MAG: DUF4917 family protein [Legionella sp.]|nr:MAG: DUF4917 family protein [Legionella sp.]